MIRSNLRCCDSRKRAIALAVTAIAVFIDPRLIVAEEPARRSDAELRVALIGTWEIDLPSTDYPFTKGFSRYHSDGRVEQIGVLGNAGLAGRWEFDGRWAIENGTLIETPVKAIPAARLGKASKSRIVAVDARRLSLSASGRSVELRRSSLPAKLPPISRWVFEMARSATERQRFGVETRNPVYPEEARLKRLEGNGIFRLEVASDGRVSRIDVLESTGNSSLDRAAFTALQGWKYKPGAVKEAIVPILFRMHGL